MEFLTKQKVIIVKNLINRKLQVKKVLGPPDAKN